MSRWLSSRWAESVSANFLFESGLLEERRMHRCFGNCLSARSQQMRATCNAARSFFEAIRNVRRSKSSDPNRTHDRLLVHSGTFARTNTSICHRPRACARLKRFRPAFNLHARIIKRSKCVCTCSNSPSVFSNVAAKPNFSASEASYLLATCAAKRKNHFASRN